MVVVNTSWPGAARPSPGSWLATATVTAFVGSVCRATVKAAGPPASVAAPVTLPTASPYSLSWLNAVSVTAAIPS